MSDQAAFDFIKVPDRRRPKRSERVFICAFAGPAAAAIEQCRHRIMQENAVFVKGIPRDRFHISLCFIGDFGRIRSHVPFAARRAAERIGLPPFEVTLSRAVTLPGFRRDRPTVLLAEGKELRQLCASLFHCLRQEGLRPTEPGMPHLTLFYSSRAIRPTDIEPIRFQADRFCLIHSERGLTRYNELGCWPLVGSPDSTPPALLAFGSMAAYGPSR